MLHSYIITISLCAVLVIQFKCTQGLKKLIQARVKTRELSDLTNTIGKGPQQRQGTATNLQILRVTHRLKYTRESMLYTGETIKQSKRRQKNKTKTKNNDRKCRARQDTSGENLQNITGNPELTAEPKQSIYCYLPYLTIKHPLY